MSNTPESHPRPGSTAGHHERRLYIADLAARMAAMESGQAALQPLPYRVLAKRLRGAAAGIPEHALRGRFGLLQPLVDDALAQRHFDLHGRLPEPEGAACRAVAQVLLNGLRRRRSLQRRG